MVGAVVAAIGHMKGDRRMETGRWQRIEELFHAAAALEPGERPALLSRSCGTDAGLRAEVESLLLASGSADERVDGAVIEALELALESDGAPRHLGPYKILRELGEGGLATVYLAERSDEQYRMTVAIKVVKRGMDTAEILSRLRLERQILASLKHPNIAQLLDGGSTEVGQPYVVMEYIDGEPIDGYCHRRGLSVAERLELFRTVCSAVHHAHQNLIIHRDIKPSNLLVSEDGVPKLLDFGIAKLLDSERLGTTVAHTVTGLQLLTPDYASPEQVRGEVLTTATDVYSLGVLLYRLLTGRRPYDFATRRPQEIERVICEVDPEPPSVAVGRGKTESGDTSGTSEKLGRRLAGDLDNIVLMALRKEPRRRYASVEQLSEDLGRYLRSQPVIARRDTLSYRTTKFFQRHRGAVIAASLVALVLLAGIVATTWATIVANDERGRAERHLDEAEEITRFLISLFEVSNLGGARSREITARELLELGTRRIDVELGDQPARRAHLMSALGQVHQNLGLYSKARELLTEAIELRRQALGPEDAQVASGLVELASVLYDEGDFTTAAAMLDEALGMQRRLYGTEHREIAATLSLMAVVAHGQGDSERAEPLFRRALAMRTELLGAEHLEVAETLVDLAEMLYAKREMAEAEQLFRRALGLRREHLGSEHPDVAVVLSNLAAVLNAQQDRDGAEQLTREVLELRLKLLGEEHPAIALSYNNLAASLQAQGRYQEAEGWQRRALDLSKELLGEEHPSVAAYTKNLAVCLDQLGRVEEAERLFQETLTLRRRALGDEHVDVARTLFTLAMFYKSHDRQPEAVDLLHEALEIQRLSLGSEDFRLSYPLLELGRLSAEQGDCEAALPLLREAATLRREAGEAQRAAVSDALTLCSDLSSDTPTAR